MIEAAEKCYEMSVTMNQKIEVEGMVRWVPMQAVRDGTMSANMAARSFSVPPSTLKDRISGRVKHGTKSGPIPYLDEAEEGF